MRCVGRTTIKMQRRRSLLATSLAYRHRSPSPPWNDLQGLAHRLENLGLRGKTLFINDSKATNAGAAVRALAAYDHIYWIAGGKAKEEGASPLRDELGKVEKTFLIGEAAGLFSEQLAGATPVEMCADLKSAVMRAFAEAEASEWEQPVVILSPACSSYDQFKNFEARGDAFRDIVNQLETANGEAA